MKNETYAHHIASLAQRAILYEVSVTPKPGLVDRENNGSHSDMDFFTFMSSSSALYKGMYEFTLAGINFKGQNPTDLFNDIRPIGIRCEKSMFLATQNINTHKGIIFSFGIICAAIGHLYSIYNRKIFSTEEICDISKNMVKDLTIKDFNNLSKKENLTHGEYLYKNFGLKGIRGEAESGFKTIMTGPISIVRNWDKNSQIFNSKNDLFLDILLHIMASSEDTNIVTRGGIQSLTYVQKISKEFLEKGGIRQKNAKTILNDMNVDFIKLNISPGGSADLLALTIFLALVEGIEL